MVPARQDDGEGQWGQTREHRPGNGDVACERPVDLVHLSRQTLGDEALEREVLGLFVSQSEIFLERLLAASSADSWRLAAHTIKGSARNIGAWDLAAAAFAAEQIDPASGDQASEARSRVSEALTRTNRFIGTLLPQTQ